MKRLIITYNKKRDIWTVLFPRGVKRNYGSLSTLLNVITDFYGPITE